MSPLRIAGAGAALAALAVAGAAPAADAPAPRPVVTMSAEVTPGRLPIPQGTPMTLRLDTRFRSVPTGANFVLERADFLFGAGARVNGAIFPSCSAAKILRAHGRLSVCPRGSQVGHGIAVGRAVAVGIRSSGRLTVFNGPGGRSIVVNVLVIRPALIKATFEVPIERLRGSRYAFRLSTVVPPELRTVLDGDIVVERLDLTAGATLTIGGRRRGYLEATRCPRRGTAIRGDFRFNQGARAVADLRVVC